MNKFLRSLDITFRRDPTNYRPRINKMNSLKDNEQKGESVIWMGLMVASGSFFFVDTD